MFWPALAALQSALVPMLITAAVVVAVVVAGFCWLGRRNGGQLPNAGHDNAAPIDDSDFASAAPSPGQAPPPASAPPAPPLLPLAADLLVVDDSAVARAKLRRLFAAAGYQVQLARDGVEALAMLQTGRYALMITDLEMPNLDGVQLISTCQRQPHTAGMPILAITGHDDLQARLNECQEICGIYRKPWIDEDLSSHVAWLLSPSHHSQTEAVDA